MLGSTKEGGGPLMEGRRHFEIGSSSYPEQPHDLKTEQKDGDGRSSLTKYNAERAEPTAIGERRATSAPNKRKYPETSGHHPQHGLYQTPSTTKKANRNQHDYKDGAAARFAPDGGIVINPTREAMRRGGAISQGHTRDAHPDPFALLGLHNSEERQRKEHEAFLLLQQRRQEMGTGMIPQNRSSALNYHRAADDRRPAGASRIPGSTMAHPHQRGITTAGNGGRSDLTSSPTRMEQDLNFARRKPAGEFVVDGVRERLSDPERETSRSVINAGGSAEKMRQSQEYHSQVASLHNRINVGGNKGRGVMEKDGDHENDDDRIFGMKDRSSSAASFGGRNDSEDYESLVVGDAGSKVLSSTNFAGVEGGKQAKLERLVSSQYGYASHSDNPSAVAAASRSCFSAEEAETTSFRDPYAMTAPASALSTRTFAAGSHPAPFLCPSMAEDKYIRQQKQLDALERRLAEYESRAGIESLRGRRADDDYDTSTATRAPISDSPPVRKSTARRGAVSISEECDSGVHRGGPRKRWEGVYRRNNIQEEYAGRRGTSDQKPVVEGDGRGSSYSDDWKLSSKNGAFYHSDDVRREFFDTQKRSHYDSVDAKNASNRLQPASSASITPTGRGERCTILYLEKDDLVLSQYQCLVRKQIELFEATEDDVQFIISKMSKPVTRGQVGIRCRHCASMPQYARPKAAIYFPRSLDSMYQFGQNMVKNHLLVICHAIPQDILDQMNELQEKRKRGKGGRELWAKAARELGVVETVDGLRFAR